MNLKQETLWEAIENRRTMKPVDYTGETIDDHLVQNILEAANWAPTHGYTEPWRFCVYKSEAKQALAQFLADLDQPDLQDSDFNAQRYERLQTRFDQVSHVIGIGLQPGDNPKVPEIEEVCSVAMAVQNMWLMAHQTGLAGYWSTGSLAFRDELRAYFGLPDNAKTLGFFLLGLPAKEARPGRRLSPIDQKTTWFSEAPKD